MMVLELMDTLAHSEPESYCRLPVIPLQAAESSGKSRAWNLPSTCFCDCYPCLMNGKGKDTGPTSSVRESCELNVHPRLTSRAQRRET